MNKKILILGDGLLGTELQKQTKWDLISRQKDGFDITKPENWDQYLLETFEGCAQSNKYDTIVNCIAHTDVYNTEKQQHWDINYKGVADLVDICNKWNIKLIHISTDYVYENSVNFAKETDIPVHGKTWYAYTKLLADAYIELKSNNYLICRGTHKATPFAYNVAWLDQIGNFDYVDIIAGLILELIEKGASGIYNIGTKTKTIYELAIKTRPDIEGVLKLNHPIPDNTTMDNSKLNRYHLGKFEGLIR